MQVQRDIEKMDAKIEETIDKLGEKWYIKVAIELSGGLDQSNQLLGQSDL